MKVDSVAEGVLRFVIAILVAIGVLLAAAVGVWQAETHSTDAR